MATQIKIMEGVLACTRAHTYTHTLFSFVVLKKKKKLVLSSAFGLSLCLYDWLVLPPHGHFVAVPTSLCENSKVPYRLKKIGDSLFRVLQLLNLSKSRSLPSAMSKLALQFLNSL